MNTDDFMRGQQDCMDGKPHQAGQSDSYDRGYATQYEHEQVQSWLDAAKDVNEYREREAKGGWHE